MAVSFVPLHKVVVAAVVKRTKDEFSLPIRLSLKDELEDVVKDAAPADRQGQFAALFLDGVDIMEGGDAGGASGSFRSYALSRRGGGVRSYVREPNEQEDGATGEEDGWGGQYDTMLKMNLVPVKFNFTFWYGTTDLSELMDMLVSWAFARQKRRLDFKLKYMALDMDISCRPSGSMSVARKSPDTDTGGYLLYEGQLEVYGYVNRDDARDTLRRPITLHAELDAELREKSLARMLAGVGQDDKAVSLSTTVAGEGTPSNAEQKKTSWNDILDKPLAVDQAEAEAGAAATVRMWTAQRVRQVVDAVVSSLQVAWGRVSGKPATATRWPTWNEVADKPALAPANAEQNVKANWNETDTASDAFVENKPTIPGNAEIDARIDAPARAGNMATWPLAKLPYSSRTADGIVSAAQAVRIDDSIDSAHLHSTPSINAAQLQSGDAFLLDDASVDNDSGSQLKEIDVSDLDTRWAVKPDWDAAAGNKAEVLNKPAAATQAEAEAGTETGTRLWSPSRVSQAIARLAPTAGSGGTATPAELFVIAARPAADVAITRASSERHVWSPFSTIETTVPVAASQAGNVLIIADVHVTVNRSETSDARTEYRLVRTRSSTDETLITEIAGGPSNVSSTDAPWRDATKRDGGAISWHDVAQENDVYKLEARVISNDGTNDRTYTFDRENNGLAVFGVTGGGLGQTQVDARIVAGTLAEARAGNTGRWGKAKLPLDAIYTATQRFTPALSAKLAGIENNAKDDQSPTEIRDALAGLTGNARLAASAIRDLPSGGGAASSLWTLMAQPASDVVVAQPANNTAWGDWNDLATTGAVATGNAGQVVFGADCHVVVAGTGSSGGDRCFTEFRVVRTRASVDTVLLSENVCGPRNGTNFGGIAVEASSATSGSLIGATTVQEGDTMKLQVRLAIQTTANTKSFTFAATRNEVFMAGVS